MIQKERYGRERHTRKRDSYKVHLTFGGHGPSNGKFNNPWGVAVDDTGTIYVVDKVN